MIMRAAAAVTGSARLDEWAVLTVLSDDVGHPMSQIAELTHTPPPTMTKLVDRMVASGLVYRRTDTVDRRRVFALSTARGRQQHRRLQSLIDAALTDLSDDDQLCELADELHRRVVSNPESVATSSEVV
jgi:DNA-binding MarR family transcriptional regulator